MGLNVSDERTESEREFQIVGAAVRKERKPKMRSVQGNCKRLEDKDNPRKRLKFLEPAIDKPRNSPLSRRSRLRCVAAAKKRDNNIAHCRPIKPTVNACSSSSA